MKTKKVEFDQIKVGMKVLITEDSTSVNKKGLIGTVSEKSDIASFRVQVGKPDGENNYGNWHNCGNVEVIVSNNPLRRFVEWIKEFHFQGPPSRLYKKISDYLNR